tara:strand:- start:66 stop:380 length:315 start_codon:yes stop_codon:yes gene_type:complete
MGKKMKFPKWHERPDNSDEPINKQNVLDGKNFLKTADHFISLANTKNKTIKATDIKFVILYAAARYSAHVGKNVMEVQNQEEFIQHLSAQFVDMLRENFSDPNL